ncbi:hypothetical protein D3C71_1915200 [compost metagenome]
MARGIGFFHHRRVLLRVLVHLVHGRIDLLQAGGLFLRSLHDGDDVPVDFLHFGNDGLQRLAGVADQLHALLHLVV